MNEAERSHYTVVAIALHWAIAAAIVANILLGWWMHEAVDEPATAARAFVAYQVHKSIGLSVLALTLARLGWRLAHPPPPLPAGMPAWERLAAKATHWAFYALLLLIPLSGWIYVSAGWSHETDQPLSLPTIWFGLFEVPHLFGLPEAGAETRAGVATAAIETHEALVWGALALLALHVGAALKHWLIDRDAVLPQMAPGLPVLGASEPARAEPSRRLALAGAFALTALAAVGVGASLWRPLPAQQAAAEAPAPPPPLTEAVTTEEPPAGLTATSTEETRTAAAPAAWRVDRARSSIRFSGEQGGARFNGSFARWSADIRFDADNLEASRAAVTIETASASDGNPMHDEALPGPEWFDSVNHPHAVFRTTRIRHRSGDEYEARGTLTIKGAETRIDLPFTLSIDGDRAVMSGRAVIDRADVGLGIGTATDEYVSREIDVTVRVEAQRQP